MLFRIIYTAISLALVFGGYSVICGMVTTKYHIYGYYANSLYWFFSVLGSLFCPYISYYLLGVKWSLVLGSLSYVIYILGFNLHHLYYILIVSSLNGFGAALFKTNLNVWLVSQLSNKNSLLSDLIPNTPIYNHSDEFYIGVFNTIFGLNMVFGSALGLIIYNLQLSIYWILFAITLLAVIMLCFIIPVKIDETHYISLSTFKELFYQFKFIYILCLYQGFSTIYVNSIMTLNFNGDIQMILYHFLLFSIGFCITSHILGCLAQKLNYVLFFNIFICILSGIIVIVIHYYLFSYYLYFIASFTMGLSEACTLYFFILLLKEDFSDNKASAFAYQRVIYASSACILQLLCSLVHLYVIILALNLFLILGVSIYNCQK